MELEDLKAHSYMLLTQQYYQAMQVAEGPVEVAKIATELAVKIAEVSKVTGVQKPSVKDWASDDGGLKMS